MCQSTSNCSLMDCPVGFAKWLVFAVTFMLWTVESNADPAKEQQPTAEAGINVFSLTTTDVDTKLPQLFCGSLGRELIRQSVLICARDEIGLSTLDASIGEISTVAGSPESNLYRLEASFRPISDDPTHFSIQLKLRPSSSSGKGPEWTSKPIQVSMNTPLSAIAERCEVLSREEFVEGIRELGFIASKLDPAKAESGDKVEEHLDFVSQFAVLRQRHVQRRANGETAENLGDLIRGYANLGHLIDYHWSAGSKAYKARALIYAQRLISKFGKTPYGLAHRAYARALAGDQFMAIEDLEAAKTAQGLDAPKWLNLVSAFCQYQPRVLEQTAGSHLELARYLRMRLIDPEFDQDTGIHAIEELVKIVPTNFRALEVVWDMRSVGLSRSITEGGTDRIWPAVYGQLAKIGDLPPSAVTIAELQTRQDSEERVEDEHHARREFLQLLRDASQNKTLEPKELSWRALAEILDNETFVQTLRVMETHKNLLGVPADDSIEELYPLIEAHRLAGCVKCYSSDRDVVAAAMEDVMKIADVSWAEMPGIGFAVRSFKVEPKFYRHVVKEMIRHRDNVYDDLIRAGKSNVSDLYKDVLIRLDEIAPHQPRTIVRKIQADKTFSKTDAAAIEQKYGDNAQIMLALGQKHSRWYQSDATERCLKRSIELAPTHNTYFLLASEYQRRDNLQQAQKTLEQALNLPNYGLEESNTHIRIADILMSQGNWKAASPHANAAAEAYSAAGLHCAARCAEGQKQWANAEEYYRAVSQRYPDWGDEWYHFCLRRGRGNIKAARTHSKQTLGKMKPPLNAWQVWRLVANRVVEDDFDQALELLEDPENKALKAATDSHVLIVKSLLADRLGDEAVRSKCYDNIESRLGPNAPFATLINFFRKALEKPDDPKWDRQSFDELIASTRADEVEFVYFCAGFFLDTHRESKLSREYLELAATSPEVRSRWVLFANHLLKQKQIKVGETRLRSTPESWEKNMQAARQARWAVWEGRFDDAQSLLSKAVELRPDDVSALLTRGDFHFSRGNDEAAVSDIRAALKLNPNSERALLSLAGLLAKSNQASVRNGKEALEYARKAFDGRVTKNHEQYAALAAAEAECGHFEEAVQLQKKAVELARKGEDLSKALKSFEEGKQLYFKKRPEESPAISEEPETEE